MFMTHQNCVYVIRQICSVKSSFYYIYKQQQKSNIWRKKNTNQTKNKSNAESAFWHVTKVEYKITKIWLKSNNNHAQHTFYRMSKLSSNPIQISPCYLITICDILPLYLEKKQSTVLKKETIIIILLLKKLDAQS